MTRTLAPLLAALVAGLVALGARAAATGAAQETPAMPAAPPAAPPAAASAAPAPLAPPPANLVLVTLDTTRADHLGCYGYARPTTPSLDAFAAESLLFERCYAPVPHTTPSHTSLFTGVFPYEHGVVACSFRADERVQEQRAFVPSERLRAYPQILADHGYATGGFVTAATTKRVTGLAAGFTAWGEPSGEVRPGSEALAEALAWLETAPQPFFLWLHLFDAHAPPREKNSKHVGKFAADAALRDHLAARRISGQPGTIEREFALYDAGLRLMDDHFRDLRAALETKGAWANSVVVVTGDHGEGLWQHGERTHGTVWNEQLHVPLLLRVPGRAPERVPTLLSLIDVLPTAVGAANGALPADELLLQARGRPALDEAFEESAVFSMSPPKRGEHSLTTARYKLIRRKSGDHDLYDLESDPHELCDLSAEQPELFAKLDAQLRHSISEQKRRHAWYYDGADLADDLSPEERERLRKELEAIGYAEGEGDDGAESGDGGR
ncbi:MAG: sulfatase [Planctomycetes bacterium]|nr:sulfatase [Planctomycetota bacterium]